MNPIITSFIVPSIMATILSVCINWVSKRSLDKRLEKEKSHNDKVIELLKVNLKYDQIFFTKLFQASQDLYGIYQDILPEKRYSDMEWGEACEEIAEHFESHAKRIKGFLRNYSTVLPPNIVEDLSTGIHYCVEGSFDEKYNHATNYANKLFETVENSTKVMKSIIDKQREFNTELAFKK